VRVYKEAEVLAPFTLEWSASCPGRFTPGKNPPIHTKCESEWAQSPSGWFWGTDKSLSPHGIRKQDRPACSLITTMKGWAITASGGIVNILEGGSMDYSE